MSMTMKAAAGALLFMAALTGCGSSYQESTRSAVGNMRDIIDAYNSTRPGDVASTGAVCRTAFDRLGERASELDSSSAPKAFRREASQLRSAFREARAGFRLCANSARTMSYPGMVSAAQLITVADHAIGRARSLEP